mgnify:CR=1 FL=1
MSDYHEQAQRYLILVEGGPPSNYSAWSPDVPGCVATGATVEEVEDSYTFVPEDQPARLAGLIAAFVGDRVKA